MTTTFSREYWEKFILNNPYKRTSDGKNTTMAELIESHLWWNIWIPMKKPVRGDYTKIIEDDEGRGFIIISSKNKNFSDVIIIEYALIKSDQRKNGICKTLLKNLENVYPRRLLFVWDTTAQSHGTGAWSHMGFSFITEKEIDIIKKHNLAVMDKFRVLFKKT